MKTLNLYLRDNIGSLLKISLKDITEILIVDVIEKDEAHEKETILKTIKISEL